MSINQLRYLHYEFLFVHSSPLRWLRGGSNEQGSAIASPRRAAPQPSVGVRSSALPIRGRKGFGDPQLHFALSPNPPHQPRQQRNPRRQIIQFNKLPWIVRKATTCAQAIQRGNVHRGSGIGIGCASATDILDL